jgi:hypothetical protein
MISRIKIVVGRAAARLMQWLDGEPVFYRVFSILWLASVIFVAYNLAAGSRLIMMMLIWMGATYVAPAVVWCAIPIWGTLRGLRGLWRRNLRAACLGFAVPAIGALVILFGDGPFQWFRFIVERQQYESAVTQMRIKAQLDQSNNADPEFGIAQKNPPTIAVFPWEGWAGIWFGIVYDSSDEITKPSSARSREWKSHSNGAALECTGAVRSFGDHYYFVGGVDC